MILFCTHRLTCSQSKEQLYDDVHLYYLVNYKANIEVYRCYLGVCNAMRYIFAVQLLKEVYTAVLHFLVLFSQNIRFLKTSIFFYF